MADNKIIIHEPVNKLVISTPGPQGPRGRTILNGSGAPANNLGVAGDFYYNTATTDFYGPKLSDTDRKSTRLNSSHMSESRMPSSA